ncbi:uncharacterized protein RB166_008525 [Leptodactylus fuscus]|uniref:uncharacterized protein LOC142196839 n=1 Tax=Leptodactylus fuscus TaxID=238119 RepID=UPI003F4EFFCA
MKQEQTAAVGTNNELNQHTRNQEIKCLQTRFAILTDSNISDIDKNILESLTSPQNSDNEIGNWKYRVAAVKQIVVYIPSKFLYGGKEILEMPGTDDSDALALDFINKGLNMVDAVFVMCGSSFKICEREVQDILMKSDFLQKWKTSPESSSLMFLAYPEKDAIFQFKDGDINNVETINPLEGEKRLIELEHFCQLIGMPSLPSNMDAAIFTSYILPVLHTSIHAQEGEPHEVIQRQDCYLKFTGVNRLITHLDAFISSLRKIEIQKLQNMLTPKTTEGLSASDTKEIIKMYKNRELKATRENVLIYDYDNLMTALNKKLKAVYASKLENEVAVSFGEEITEAQRKWDLNENKITSLGLFNPYYAGNHRSDTVKIYRIILEDTEQLKSTIFEFLKKEISELLNAFEKDVIELFSKELSSVLGREGDTRIETFVQQSIQDVLSNATEWYFGRLKKPINEKTVGKYLKESKKEILKTHLLKPAYDQTNLNIAKNLAKKKIPQTLMAVKEDFKNSLLEIHETRWKSFQHHSKGNTTIPQPWKVLLAKIRKSSKTENTPQQQPDEDLLEVLKMITAKNPK